MIPRRASGEDDQALAQTSWLLPPERKERPMKRDYYVTVCAACASCWQGEALASELRRERREHPSYFSVTRLREVCCVVRYAP